MNMRPQTNAPPVEKGAVVTKAVMAAAIRLGLSAASTAAILGVSAPTVSRMKKLEFSLEPGSKPFELAVLLIRVFRSLDAITGGDDEVSRQWLRSENTALSAIPAERISTITGLVDVLAYLDARRAPV